MSSLTETDKLYLERILGMADGWVLKFSDPKYGEFFQRHGIDIHGPKYQTFGPSKATKMRSFWAQESDKVVANVLSDLLELHKAECELDGKALDTAVFERSLAVVERLKGKETQKRPIQNEEDFLDREFSIPDMHLLPIEQAMVPIIKSRILEARRAMKAKTYLSVVLLCGSVLEAVLLGKAQQDPRSFNQSKASPKDKDGKVKHLQDWKLAEFIDAACEVGVLKVDVKTFSHGLRDFRNYIHPYQQLSSGFTPDEHTAKVCFQVLKAALASVAGKR